MFSLREFEAKLREENKEGLDLMCKIIEESQSEKGLTEQQHMRRLHIFHDLCRTWPREFNKNIIDTFWSEAYIYVLKEKAFNISLNETKTTTQTQM
jgi:hypothetical protein